MEWSLMRLLSLQLAGPCFFPCDASPLSHVPVQNTPEGQAGAYALNSFAFFGSIRFSRRETISIRVLWFICTRKPCRDSALWQPVVEHFRKNKAALLPSRGKLVHPIDRSIFFGRRCMRTQSTLRSFDAWKMKLAISHKPQFRGAKAKPRKTTLNNDDRLHSCADRPKRSSHERRAQRGEQASSRKKTTPGYRTTPFE